MEVYLVDLVEMSVYLLIKNRNISYNIDIFYLFCFLYSIEQQICFFNFIKLGSRLE